MDQSGVGIFHYLYCDYAAEQRAVSLQWSAVEGQQRSDNHVDKLLNYIRYWQASGESIKTSMRVKMSTPI